MVLSWWVLWLQPPIVSFNTCEGTCMWHRRCFMGKGVIGSPLPHDKSDSNATFAHLSMFLKCQHPVDLKEPTVYTPQLLPHTSAPGPLGKQRRFEWAVPTRSQSFTNPIKVTCPQKGLPGIPSKSNLHGFWLPLRSCFALRGCRRRLGSFGRCRTFHGPELNGLGFLEDLMGEDFCNSHEPIRC